MIDASLLGPVQVSVDGNAPPPELLWRRNLGLLIYLACSPKRSRTREHLTGLLWPDKAEEKARQSLREALSKIRAAVGETGVETAGDQVRLAAGAVRLDTERFQALAAAGDWSGAADIIAGPFMEGFAISGAGAFEEWLSAERREWNARGENALLRLAQGSLDGGDLEAARSAAGRAWNMAPESEAAVMTLMEALALDGKPGEALRVYESFAEHLRTELGTKPGPTCTTLADRIRSTPARIGARERRPVTNSRRAPLVGRAEQLERVLEVWRRGRDGRRAAGVILIGDPGVGKSRLAEEVTQRLRLEGAATAVIRAVGSDLTTPWNGVLGLARGGLLEAAGVSGAAPAALGWFAERIAEWADRFPAARRSGETTEAPARAFSEVLGAAAASQPVALVVDDAEYVDPDSLRALGGALRDLAHSPLFVLCTTGTAARPELDELRSQLGRDVDGAALPLSPLGADDIRRLAQWAAPEYTEAQIDRLTRRVSTDSAGFPLLVVELLCAVAMGLDLNKVASAWPEPLKTLDQSMPGELPEGIVAAIRVSFRRLSPAGQLVLKAAAVLEGPSTAARLARVTGLDPAKVAEALDELEWNRWLAADARGYVFVARIVLEVVKQDLVLKGEAQRLLEADGSA